MIKNRWASILILLLMAATVLTVTTSAFCDTPACWGNLKAGKFDVGFKTIEKYDYTRVFRPKADYFGNPVEGERARPIQICIWYPAGDISGSQRLTYGGYAFPYPNDVSFFNFVSAIQNRENNFLNVIGNMIGVPATDLINTEMGAYADVEPADGKFPLLIYFSDTGRSFAENAVLCEYLASRGFVVASTHSVGLDDINPDNTAASLETQVRDKEFMLPFLKDELMIDMNKIGVFGFAQGGLGAQIMQMRNSDIDALVALESWFMRRENAEFAEELPFFNPQKSSVPFMQICCLDTQMIDTGLYDRLKYSNRHLVQFANLRGNGFTDYNTMPTIAPDSIMTALKPQRDDYYTTCEYTLNFFKMVLEDDASAAKFIENDPKANGLDPELVKMSFTGKEELPPTPQQFVGILRSEGIPTAHEIYLKFKNLDPELVLFDEATVNMAGYQTMFAGDIENALILFQMNAECFPNSANVWDSMAEAYLNSGNREMALKHYRRALEVLETDENINPALRDAIRIGATQRVEELSSPDNAAN